MSSTSAIVAIGNMHQKDGSICPSHIAQLVEGSRSAWTLHSMGNDPVSPVVWRSDTPDRHLVALLALIASRVLLEPVADKRFMGHTLDITTADTPIIDGLAEIARSRSGLALSTTIYSGSSLNPLDLQALENLDIEISQPVWSRIWSAWSNTWVVTP